MIAAAAPPDDPADDAGLPGLHRALQLEGFAVGPRELLAATQLMVRLAEAGHFPADVDALAPMLRAVYCKSASEQRRFDPVFARWRDGRATLPAASDTAALPQGTVPPPPEPPRPWWRQSTPWLLVLVVGLGVATFWQRSLQRDSAGLAPVVEAPTTPEPAAPTPGAPPPPGTVALAAAEPDGQAGFMPQQRRQREFRPGVIALLLALPVPLLLLMYAPALALSRRHADRARRGGRVRLDVSSWRDEAERIVPAMDPSTAARLDRHLRPAADDPAAGRRALDEARTLAATLRRHGRLTLRWRTRPTRPSYLVLLDVRDEQDLRGRLFFRWADRLRREGVSVEIWLFDGDPRVLFPSHRRRVLDAQGRERNAVRFEQVANRAVWEPGRRLVLVGDGGAFFGGDGQLQPWWPTLGWERWHQRVVFTPVDSRDWGVRELAIERPLGRGDPGFLVLPLEQEALHAWAVQLTTGELPAIVLSAARRFPPLLDRLPAGGLAAEPPPPEVVEKLVAQLRLYLGENGLRWLAACTVPPVMRWELTLLIGQALFRDMGAQDEESLRWLMHTNYPRLARLPWLRHANVPDWLALRLLGELSPATQDRIREVVRALLDQVPPDSVAAGGDLLSLDVTPPTGGGGGSSGAAPPAADEAARRRQWLYLGFLDGLSPRQLAMRAPRAWRRWFAGAGQRRVVGLRATLDLALGWVRGFLARLMWRDGHAEGGASWRPMALAAVWLAVVAGALQFVARRPDDPVVAGAAAWLTAEHRIDGGAVSELPFEQVGLSGDGRRFVTVDASGEIVVRQADARAEPAGPTLHIGRAVAAVHLDVGGQRLAVIERDGRVSRWDVDSGRAIGPAVELRSFRGPMARSAASADGRWLAVSDSRNQGWLIDAGQPEMAVRPLPTPAGNRGDPPPVASLPLGFGFMTTPAGTRLLVLNGANLSDVDLVRESVQIAVMLDQRLVQRNWLSRDGRRLALFLEGGRLRVASVDGRRGFEVDVGPRWPTIDGRPAEVEFDAAGRTMAIVGTEVKVWDAEGRLVATVGSPPDSYLKTLQPAGTTVEQGLAAAGLSQLRARLLPSGAGLLVGDGSRQVMAYRWPEAATAVRSDAAASAAAAAPSLLGPPLLHHEAVVALTVAPADDQVLAVTADHQVRLWQSARLSPDPPPPRVGPGVRNPVALTVDGRLAAAAGGSDGTIVIWRSDSGRVLARIDVGRPVTGLAFSTGPRPRLLAATQDGALTLVDPVAGVVLAARDSGQRLTRPLVTTIGSDVVLSQSAEGVRSWSIGGSGLGEGSGLLDVRSAVLAEGGATAVLLTADGRVRIANAASLATRREFAVSDGPAPAPAVVVPASLTRKVAELGTAAPPPPSKAAVATAPVPNVVGQPYERARDALLAAGFGVRAQRVEQPSRMPLGTIVTSRPAAGTALPLGADVQLQVLGRVCLDGFEPRRAFAGDMVCVSSATAERVRQDNAAAAARISPKDQSYGAGRTCGVGYVWREADRYLTGDRFADDVCVTPEQRAQAVADNAARATRAAPPIPAVPAPRGSGPPAVEAPPAATTAAGLVGPAVGVAAAPGADGSLRVVVRTALQARLFDSAGRPLGPAVRHVGLTAATYAAAIDRLITAGADGQLRLWDPATGTEADSPLRHGAVPVRLLPAPDGQHLASVDADGWVRLWNLPARRALPGGPVFPGGTPELAFAAGRLAIAGADGAVGSLRLPTFETGELRVVWPRAQLWLVLLSVIVAGGIVGLAIGVHRRARAMRSIAATPATPASATA
jgi:WD40 repeat protein